jgi:cytoskeleton protein RodZ
MSSTPFGEHLKREREMRGVSLEEVSAATRISTRFLEAIESENWDSLPGGVFNRGFIRSVARYLGLDEDSIVAEYALETRGRVDAGVVPDPPMEMPRNWKPAIVTLIVLIAILGGAAFVYARYGRRIAAWLHWKGAVASAPAASLSPSDADAANNNGSSATPGATGGPSSTQNPSAIPAGALALADPLELKVQATKPVEVTIAADGKPVFRGTMEVGEAKQFEARDLLEISASEPGALALDLNGQPVSPTVQAGLPATVRLTRNDLKSPFGDSH